MGVGQRLRFAGKIFELYFWSCRHAGPGIFRGNALRIGADGINLVASASQPDFFRVQHAQNNCLSKL